jgi:hypothetical protein
MFRNGLRFTFSILVVMMLLVVMTGPALAQGNPNPGVIPNNAQYEKLSIEWWLWAFQFGTDLPFFNPGGPVDLSENQSGHVWFLAGVFFPDPSNGPVIRTGTIPSGTSLFFPLANVVVDYPCPAEFNFEPDPGESLEHFLQRFGNEFVPDLPDLFATIDGIPLTDLSSYKVTTSLFMFQADPGLSTIYDPCITGESQPGVSVGYWLWLPPLPPGEHTLHFGAPSYYGQDITYIITVVPGR